MDNLGMLEIFTQFEHSVPAYNAQILTLSGLTGVLLGIFLWLGGSLFARTSLAVVWFLLVAGICIFFVEPLVSVGIGMMAAILVMVFKRLSTGLLVSVLLTFMVFLAICQYTDTAKTTRDRSPIGQSLSNRMPLVKKGVKLSVPETCEHLKRLVAEIYRSSVQIGQALETKYQVLVGITGFFVLLIGCVLQGLANATSCATAGVLLIWGGMVLMLLPKGVLPLTGLFRQADTYVAVMSAMIGVGALEQLLFCSGAKGKDEDKKGSSGKKGK
jgi:hypothetical protein